MRSVFDERRISLLSLEEVARSAIDPKYEYYVLANPYERSGKGYGGAGSTNL